MENRNTCTYFHRMRSSCSNDYQCGHKRHDADGHVFCNIDGILEMDRIKAKEIKEHGETLVN